MPFYETDFGESRSKANYFTFFKKSHAIAILIIVNTRTAWIKGSGDAPRGGCYIRKVSSQNRF